MAKLKTQSDIGSKINLIAVGQKGSTNNSEPLPMTFYTLEQLDNYIHNGKTVYQSQTNEEN